jgi:hypothetical protein
MTTLPLQFELTHPSHGKMVFVPVGKGDVVKILYYDGASHKSLTDGFKTTEDAKTGIKRARTIWNDKVKEGWTTHGRIST